MTWPRSSTRSSHGARPGHSSCTLHDIGGPIGRRIATARPERIAGLIFQNFTISVGGWNPERLKVYERLGGPETPEKLAETEQFATANRIFMSRLFMNLTTNIQHYPEWTAYLKDRQPKTLIVWGKNDPLMLPAAAEFVKQVVP